jgi:hypothetical protein
MRLRGFGGGRGGPARGCEADCPVAAEEGHRSCGRCPGKCGDPGRFRWRSLRRNLFRRSVHVGRPRPDHPVGAPSERTRPGHGEYRIHETGSPILPRQVELLRRIPEGAAHDWPGRQNQANSPEDRTIGRSGAVCHRFVQGSVGGLLPLGRSAKSRRCRSDRARKRRASDDHTPMEHRRGSFGPVQRVSGRARAVPPAKESAGPSRTRNAAKAQIVSFRHLDPRDGGRFPFA